MEYRPLDFAGFEFRLLTILDNGAGDSVIPCNLNTASLLDPPEYQAVSYCWGDPSITKPVVVNGHTVHVTTNLAAALKELRAQGFKTLWIDALCINQNDPVERGLQVARMGLIFSRSYRVLAWLGPETDSSVSAIEMIYEYRRRSSRRPTQINDTPLHDLFARPFWSRVWIIQEVAKAQDLLFLCGSKSFDWAQLQRSFSRLKQLPPEVLALEEFRRQEQMRKPPLLLSALGRSRSFKSSDIRDKIYALLGLTSDGSEIVSTPNYVQSPEKIYFQIFKEYLARNSNYSYLTRSVAHKQVPEVGKVPDWINLDEGVPRFICSILQHEFKSPKNEFESFMALSRYFTVELRYLPMSGNNRRIYRLLPYLSYSGLVASGCILDSIGSLATPFNIPRDARSHEPDEQKPAKNFIRRYLKDNFYRTFKIPTTGQPTDSSAVLDDFWQALSCLINVERIFLMYGKFDEIRTAYAFTHIFAQANWMPFKHPENGIEHFSNWLFANENLVYHGKTLRRWVDLYSNTNSYRKDYRTASTERHHHFIHWDVEDDIKILLSAVRNASNLRFAVGKNSQALGFVGNKAREGDLIFLVRGAFTPVVLRRDGNAYRFVCETVFPPSNRPTRAQKIWEVKQGQVGGPSELRSQPPMELGTTRRQYERRVVSSDSFEIYSSDSEDSRESTLTDRRWETLVIC